MQNTSTHTRTGILPLPRDEEVSILAKPVTGHPGIRTVPAYEEDGSIQIGEFIIAPARRGRLVARDVSAVIMVFL